ncbi:MAG: UDP-N-acetylmuramate:L-alanyl-gamma-D-glutamyl-meso-diaminopimelate ligase, partial [Zetaproteobacteria bacterium]
LEADGSRFAIYAPDGTTHTIQWSQIGAHLAANACAAIAAACEGFGVPFADACQAIAAWPGVRRRMTLLTEAQGVRIWEDFAHHPTAIRAVIAALAARRARERRGSTLWVVLEPASNTMRRKVHEKALPEALARADRVILLPPEPRGLAKAELLDVRAVAKALGARAQVAEDPKAGAAEIAQSLRPGDDVLLLSNASLRGVREALLRALSG